MIAVAANPVMMFKLSFAIMTTILLSMHRVALRQSAVRKHRQQ